MRFSVVIPYFNISFDILSRSCLSVITAFNFIQNDIHSLEIILVNDGSNIVDFSSKLDSFVSIYKSNQISFLLINNKINLGRSYSRNVGISRSNSDYISFLDSDDVYMNNFYTSFLQSYNFNSSFDFYTFSYKINCFNNFRLNHYSKSKYNEWKYFCTISIMIKNEICRKYFFDETLSKGEDIKYFKELIYSHKGLHTNDLVSKYNYDYKSYNSKFNFGGIKFLYYFIKYNLYIFKLKMYKYSIVY